MAHMHRIALTLSMAFALADAAAAQPLGPFRWQLQPFCNVLTLHVTQQQGSTFALDGYDDRCGAATRTAVAGVAFVNPNGTVGLGLAAVPSGGGQPTTIEATISLATLSGTWRVDLLLDGTFAFNAAAGGPALPPLTGGIFATNYNTSANFYGLRAQGTPATPTALTNGQAIATFQGLGHEGVAFDAAANITIRTTENWTPTTTGAQIQFYTTPNGSTLASARMTVHHNGNVGIGTTAPINLLHVNGSVRIGSCVYEADGDVACVSDRRFKQNIRPLSPILDRLVTLEPVRYSWRADAFPERGFHQDESTGLVAQDVERVLPELVTTDADGYKAVNYGRLPLLAVQAIRELKVENDSVKERNAELERRLLTLEAAMARLSASLDARDRR